MGFILAGCEQILYNEYNDVRINLSGTDPERIHK